MVEEVLVSTVHIRIPLHNSIPDSFATADVLLVGVSEHLADSSLAAVVLRR